MDNINQSGVYSGLVSEIRNMFRIGYFVTPYFKKRNFALEGISQKFMGKQLFELSCIKPQF